MLIAVTNRKLSKNFDDFIERIKILTQLQIDGIILREKDLNIYDYEYLLKKILKINKNIIINSNINSAYKFGVNNIQLSFNSFKLNYHYVKRCFKNIFVSVHNFSEAIYASEKGANYIILGHIFNTKCKLNKPPIGLKLLNQISNDINTPILAIGGINLENIINVFKFGAYGICLMSEMMEIDNLQNRVIKYQTLIKKIKQ